MKVSKSVKFLIVSLMLLTLFPSVKAQEAEPSQLSERAGACTKEEMLAKLGKPDASFFDGKCECWLYARIDSEENKCPAYMIKDGRNFQINWIEPEIMKKGIEAANSFAGWKGPAEFKKKNFYHFGNPVLTGDTKTDLEFKLGQPDIKRVYIPKGIEVWEYRLVPASATDERLYTLFIEFEDDRVKRIP